MFYRVVLLSISSMLLDPCPENGYGNEAEELYMSDKEQYDIIAREWVQEYAKKPEKNPVIVNTEEEE